MPRNPIIEEPVLRSALPATITALIWRVAVGYTETPNPVAAMLDEFFPLYALLFFTIMGFQRAIRSACMIGLRTVVGVLGRRLPRSHDLLWHECGTAPLRPVEAILNLFAGQLFVLVFLLSLIAFSQRIPWHPHVPTWLLAASAVLTGATMVWALTIIFSKASCFQNRSFIPAWHRDDRAFGRRPRHHVRA